MSDTSTEYDREVKLPLYARYGIAEVWLVGLEAGTVETLRSPTAEGYQEVTPTWPTGFSSATSTSANMWTSWATTGS